MPAHSIRSTIGPRGRKGTNGPEAPVPNSLMQALLAAAGSPTPRRVLVPYAAHCVDLVTELSKTDVKIDVSEVEEATLLELSGMRINVAIGADFADMEPHPSYDVVLIGVDVAWDVLERARGFLAIGGRVVALVKLDDAGDLPVDGAVPGLRVTGLAGHPGVAIVVIPNRGA